MGINSTEVSYGFGQFGSAFSDTDANTIRPPEGLVIVAIHFLGAAGLDDLRIAGDDNIYPNTSTAANSKGNFTRQVNQGTGAATKIIFDEENDVSDSDSIKVGDEVYDAEGVLFGTVVTLNPDDDNTKEIELSGSNTVTDNEVLSFVTPNTIATEGVGGQALAAGNLFAAGSTIYGRWDSASIAADAATAGIICYFGK